MRKTKAPRTISWATFISGLAIGIVTTAIYFNAFVLSGPRQPDSRPIQTLLLEASKAFHAKNYALSMQFYQDVLAKDPDNYDANKYAGTLFASYLEPRDPDRALVHMRKALTFKDDTIEKRSYGQVLYELKRYAESEKVFKEIVGQDKKNVHAWEYLGHSLKDQGKKKEAMAAFNEALKLEPDAKNSVKASIEWIKKNP